MRLALSVIFFVPAIWALAPKGVWDSFNYAPKTKTVYPTVIHGVNGSVINAENLITNSGSATLSGDGAWVALDYGVEVMSFTRSFGGSRIVRINARSGASSQ